MVNIREVTVRPPQPGTVDTEQGAEADEQASEIPFEVVGQLADLDASTPFAAGLQLIARWSAREKGRTLLLSINGSWLGRADP